MYLLSKIDKIGKDNVIIEIEVMPNENEAFLCEISRISAIGRKILNTGPLVNLTSGGEGGSGRVVTEETRIKLAASAIGNKNSIGRKYICSESTKEKLRICNLGRKHTEETKKKISLAGVGNKNRLGCKVSDETRKRMSLSRVGNKNSLGYKQSEETKRKRAESIREHYRNKKQRKIK